MGFVTEPAHSGMPPSLPTPVETLAPPLKNDRFLCVGIVLRSVSIIAPYGEILQAMIQLTCCTLYRTRHLAIGLFTLKVLTLVMHLLATSNADFELDQTVLEIDFGRQQG